MKNLCAMILLAALPLWAAPTAGWQETGVHMVSFDGSNLAGGVYFANLKAGNFKAVRKMIFLK